MPEITCSECGGSMEEGFLLDRGAGEETPAAWVEGPPEKSWWFGLKTRGKPKHRVVSYRCERCGLLKSYARIAPAT